MSLGLMRSRVVCLTQMMGQAFACVGHGRVVCRVSPRSFYENKLSDAYGVLHMASIVLVSHLYASVQALALLS